MSESRVPPIMPKRCWVGELGLLAVFIVAGCGTAQTPSSVRPSSSTVSAQAVVAPTPAIMTPTSTAELLPPTPTLQAPPSNTTSPSATPTGAPPVLARSTAMESSTPVVPTPAMPTLTRVATATRPLSPSPLRTAWPTAGCCCPQGCASPPPSCTIKGNISSDGEKIYHMPGQRNYEATIIDPQKGERWFCTEGEAIANGWRKAKQ